MNECGKTESKRSKNEDPSGQEKNKYTVLGTKIWILEFPSFLEYVIHNKKEE